MSSSLVWQFADEKATFARGRVLGHTGLPLYKSSFAGAEAHWTQIKWWPRGSRDHCGESLAQVK